MCYIDGAIFNKIWQLATMNQYLLHWWCYIELVFLYSFTLFESLKPLTLSLISKFSLSLSSLSPLSNCLVAIRMGFDRAMGCCGVDWVIGCGCGGGSHRGLLWMWWTIDRLVLVKSLGHWVCVVVFGIFGSLGYDVVIVGGGVVGGFDMEFFLGQWVYGHGLWQLVLLVVDCAWWLLLPVVISSKKGERQRGRERKGWRLKKE